MRLGKFFLVIILFAAVQISAQNYMLHGIVIDHDDSEPLLGVNLLIEQLKIGTQSNDKGEFEFKNIPAGDYTIKITYIGHKTNLATAHVPQEKDLVIQMNEGSVDLKEVVVTGNPLSKDPKDISQSTITIANLELQIRAANNIGQILNYQPGISMRSNGTAAARPVIRGFSNNRILILENGLRTGDLSNSSDDHAVSSDGNAAEKIEVLRGPASLLYGSNAIGGVINVLTESIPNYISRKIDGEVNLDYSSNNKEFLGNTDIHYGLGQLGFHFNYFNRRNDDYTDGLGEAVFNSSQKTNGYQFGTSFIPSFGIVGISYSKYSNEYDIPFNRQEFLNPNSEGPTMIKMSKNEGRFLIESSQLNSFISSFSFKGGVQDYSHDEISKTSGAIGTSFAMKSFSTDLSFKHTPIASLVQGVFGFWGMKQKYSVQGEEALTPNADYNSVAAYLLEQLRLDGFSVQSGFRFELNQIKIPEAILSNKYFSPDEQTYRTLSGSIGLVYNITENTSVFTNLANAFRSPTIEELSSYAVHGATGTFDIGNRNLKNENNIGVDLGLRVRMENHFVEFSTYFNSITNYIFRKPADLLYDSSNEANPFNPSNGIRVYEYAQSDVTIYGFELKALYDETKNLSTTLIMDYVRGFEKDTKENLPQMPPFRFSIEQKYTTDGFWCGANVKLTAEQNLVADNETITKGFGLIDVYGGFRFLLGSYISSVTLKIDNLLDQPYKEHLSSIKDFAFMPGRNIKLNYKFLF